MGPEARTTHRHEGPVVVFLIGVRVTRWWRPDEWWPVFTAMPRMLRELAHDPASGLLGWRTCLGAGGPLVVQYWASEEQLWAFARDQGRTHRPAWQAYNARARRGRRSVGIWHETFPVPAGAAESRYVAMAPAGLARATASVPFRPQPGRDLDAS